MKVNDSVRTVLRLLFLVAVLMSIAVVSAITTIRLTVHGRQETLPNLVGMPISQARSTARSLGLNLDVEDRLYSDKIAPEAVVSQMPAAGTSIKPQQQIHILLSLGPQKVSVPDVVGRSIRAARITAVERGLTIGDVAALYWPQAEQNQVVAQDPPPATTDLQSPAVNFLVSLGPTPAAYLCPNFQGKPVGVVQSELEQAGFQNIRITQAAVAGALQGNIIQQLPLPGSRVTPNTVFEFQVAQ
ncbi:MAG: PASTA domain-containing protein [Acidobacteria bacterium]|nr:MAG: PASTA domain-containing protein [Acidobacteriota bacterium]